MWISNNTRQENKSNLAATLILDGDFLRQTIAEKLFVLKRVKKDSFRFIPLITELFADIMKKMLTLLAGHFIAVAVFAQTHKALFVIVDGIPADLIEKLSTPALDAIAKEGGYTRALVGGEKGGYSQTPTISAVGYNTVLTGTWVNKHNVWDNDIAAPNYNYPTIFRLYKNQYPDGKIAVFSSWLDNRTRLVGDGLPQTGYIKVDHHFDGLELDTVQFPHDKQAQYMHRIDEAVVNHAAAYIRSDAPDLSWVYLEFTDDMGHRHGDSKEYYDAIGKMDDQMRRLWEAIQYRQQQFGEEWQIYITTDHGRDSATGRGHGGQSAREKSGWIVTNAKGLNDQFKKGYASIADIMPSLARFMNISIPNAQAYEVDGTPLIGAIDAVQAQATLQNDQLNISWKPLRKKGNVRIWLAAANQVKTGGKDDYQLVKTVKLKSGKVSIPVSAPAQPLYKIVIETPHNLLTRWAVTTTKP